MAQFDVHANPVKSQRQDIPWCVDIQSDLLASLGTRLVIPLALRQHAPPGSPHRLCPVVPWEGDSFVALPQLTAPFRVKDLGPALGSVRTHAVDLVAAIDTLMSGV